MQVKYILGYNIPHVDRIQDLVYNLVANAHLFKWREFVMGITWIALLLLIKNAPRWHKYVPRGQQCSDAGCCIDSIDCHSTCIA